MEEFAKVGLQLTEEQCIQTTGIRIDEVCDYWYLRHPWNGSTPKEVSVKIRERVEELVSEKGEGLPGVYETVEKVRSLNLPLALCSSSPMSLIKVVLNRLELNDAFDELISAEFEEYGKPHPAVYINAVKRLKQTSEFCLTFEDTLAGVISAKAAKLKVVAVPQKEHRDDPRFILADYRLNSLLEFDWNSI